MPAKSPLKWAGGKSWLVPALRPIYAALGFPRVVEPFCGSCAVSLGLGAVRATCGDANGELINFWRQADAVAREWRDWPNDHATFYATRLLFNKMRGRGGVWQAARFFYLNRTCYNGLWRVNKAGAFNVPFGGYADPRLASRMAETLLPPAIDATRDWLFLRQPFADTIANASCRDLLYVDPPYWQTFDGYQAGGFSWQDHRDLAALIAARRGPTVVSNSDRPEIVELYRSAGLEVLRVASRLNRIRPHKDQAPTTEILAWKDAPLNNIGQPA